MPEWHSSWNRMRGAKGRRSWMTLGELLVAIRERGLDATRHVVLRAVAGDPPPNVNGIKRYGRHHLEMVAVEARSRSTRRAT